MPGAADVVGLARGRRSPASPAACCGRMAMPRPPNPPPMMAMPRARPCWPPLRLAGVPAGAVPLVQALTVPSGTSRSREAEIECDPRHNDPRGPEAAASCSAWPTAWPRRATRRPRSPTSWRTRGSQAHVLRTLRRQGRLPAGRVRARLRPDDGGAAGDPLPPAGTGPNGSAPSSRLPRRWRRCRRSTGPAAGGTGRGPGATGCGRAPSAASPTCCANWSSRPGAEPEVRPLSPVLALAIVGGINELMLHALDPYAGPARRGRPGAPVHRVDRGGHRAGLGRAGVPRPGGRRPQRPRCRRTRRGAPGRRA